MKEIGSEFSWVDEPTNKNENLPSWLPYGNDWMLTFSGRTAFETVIRDIGILNKVLFPSYCCSSMIEPFIKAGIKIEFYDVSWSNGLCINLEIPADCDAVVICNYFGFCVSYPVETLCAFQQSGGILIEDITHSLLSEKQTLCESDYLVASLRKWGPLISGGFCSKCKGKFSFELNKKPNDEFTLTKLKAMTLKSQYLTGFNDKDKDEFLNLFSQSAQWIEKNYSHLTIDDISKKCLLSWDVNQMREKRRKNAEELYKHFADLKITPMFEWDEIDCPLFVPVIIDEQRRDFMRKKLIEHRVYCPIHWPRPSEESYSELYATEMSLICDQRYDVADMQKIVDIIRKD